MSQRSTRDQQLDENFVVGLAVLDHSTPNSRSTKLAWPGASPPLNSSGRCSRLIDRLTTVRKLLTQARSPVGIAGKLARKPSGLLLREAPVAEGVPVVN